MGGFELRSEAYPDTAELRAVLAHLTRLVGESSPLRVAKYGHSRVDDWTGSPTDSTPGSVFTGHTVTLQIKFTVA